MVDQESNSKPLYIHVGDLNPKTCIDWECACRHYANNKDIPANKIVKCTLDGIEDVHFVNWIGLDREHLEAMTLDEFMTLFCNTHLAPNWQDNTCITLSCMTQDPMNFWEFQVAVQSTNALLKGTAHYLDEVKLRERIEAGINQVLYVQATNTKLNLVKDFHKWLAKVKQLDDEKCFKCDQAIKAFEPSVAASHAASCDAATQNMFSSPSCQANVASATPTTVTTAPPKADYPPRLTDDKKCLLLKYNSDTSSNAMWSEHNHTNTI
jgi:hypothetical protein